MEREREQGRERDREKLTKVGRIINTGEFLVLFYREFWLYFLETPDAKCFTHFSSLLSGLLIFMTRWEMTLNGTFLQCCFPITTHPHPRAASLGLAVVAKPAGVLKIYLLKHVVQHHLFHS